MYYKSKMPTLQTNFLIMYKIANLNFLLSVILYLKPGLRYWYLRCLIYISVSEMCTFYPFPEHILKENLTVVPQFHSHLEPMRNIGDLDKQITLSFSDDNTIGLDGPFSKQVDPTRYFSFSFYSGWTDNKFWRSDTCRVQCNE